MAGSLPKMKLWFHPKLRSTRCVWLIKELGIEHAVDYKPVPIGPSPLAQAREEYKQSVHSHGTVPALEIEGRPPMLESGAICLYLADLCGRLAPEHGNRSEYYNWTFYCTSTLDGAMATLARQWMFTPREQQDQQLISKAKDLADVCLDNLNNALNGKRFILGDDVQAATITAPSACSYLARSPKSVLGTRSVVQEGRGTQRVTTMTTRAYIWWMDDPWAALVTMAIVIFFLSVVLIVVVIVTYSRYVKYINQHRVYQTSYEHPDFVEPPSFIREYETQSLNMYVPPDESTQNFGEMGMRIQGDTVVDVQHTAHISGVVAAINPMFQYDHHTSHSEPHSSSIHSTSLGESTTIL